MIAAGKTYRETVDYLNAQGYRRRDGRPLSYFITDRLRNRQYTGEYVFNLYKHVKTKDGRKYKRKSESEVIRIPNGMPAIIDTETFEKVQQKMDARKSHKIRKVHGKYLLTGLITCGVGVLVKQFFATLDFKGKRYSLISSKMVGKMGKEGKA